MTRRLRDDQILPVLPYATGSGREVIVHALAYSEGAEGTATLERIYATEKGTLRSAALFGLARRTREASTERCVEALRSTSVNLQELAALLLAEWGTRAALPHVLEWLERKLARENGTGSPFVLPSAIRFAARHEALGQVARVLDAQWHRLTADERDWLGRTWPDAFHEAGGLHDPGVASRPVLLETDVYEDEHGPTPSMTAPPDELWWEEFDHAYGKATRRAAKQAQR